MMKLSWMSLLMLSAVGAAAEPVAIPLNGDEGGVWKVEHAEAARKTFAVAEVDKPSISEDEYAVVGEVRYQGVQGMSFIEMWSHLGERSFFSRTVEDKGPMRAITGDSDWRTFALPFFKGEESDPEKLVINLVLEGQGTVELRNLQLITGSQWRGALYPGAWWGPQISGILGAVLGVSAGLLGTLMGVGMKSPSRHGLAKGCAVVLLVIGVGSLMVMVAAFATGQPKSISLLFALMGVIGSWAGVDALRKVKHQRTQSELRRMEAADAAGGQINA